VECLGLVGFRVRSSDETLLLGGVREQIVQSCLAFYDQGADKAHVLTITPPGRVG
jgi:hypothetical protein